MIQIRLRKRADIRLVAAATALVGAMGASGCAGRTHSFSGRFVKAGVPSATFDAATSAPQHAELKDYVRRLRAVQANARTNVTLGARIESRDPTLASALLKVAMAPTAENHRLVAEAYRASGITDFAFRHLQRALQLEPCDSGAWEGLARLWRDWRVPELALTDAHRAVYCAPHSPSAHNTLGTVLIALGQPDAAKQAFEAALRFDDGAAFALNNLCYAHLLGGDAVAAEEACEEALAVQPRMVAAQTNLALAYAMQGDIPQAEGRLQARADTAIGLYNVGVLRMSLKQFGAAAQAFDLAASTRPSLADAARRAAQARARIAGQKEP